MVLLIAFNNILGKLSDCGWSAYRLTKEKIIASSTIDRLRHGDPITTDTIDKICELCQCQPGDLLSWIPNNQEE